MAVVGTGIAVAAKALGLSAAAAGVAATIGTRLLTSVAVSALMSAAQPAPRTPGIQTEIEQTGGTHPVSFPLGTTATAGTRLAPLMSHGAAGKTPNAYLTMIRAVSWLPGVSLRRVVINGEWVTISTTNQHADYGYEIEGKFQGRAWIRFYDGTQTVADPMLVAKYGAHPDFPWSSAMVMEGIAYAVMTFRYDRKVFSGGLPSVLFEVGSIPLYDPRKDDTVGGTGSHRWDDASTWEPTDNLAVLRYNVLRGIPLWDGYVWGGGLTAAQVRLSDAFATMNECDLLVDDGQGGTEPQFVGGIEVSVDQDPADIEQELSKACAGWIAEVADGIRMGVGAPGAAVMSFTDTDVLLTKPEEKRPFPGLEAAFNGVTATYPEPAALWQATEAEPLHDLTAEAEDGERHVAEITFRALSNVRQARRVMQADLSDERRFQRHSQVLPPWAVALEPGDVVSWTSDENGYSAADLEVFEIGSGSATGAIPLSSKLVDAADWTPPPGFDLGTPPDEPTVTPPAPLTVEGFSATAFAIQDSASADRRPGILHQWSVSDLPEADALAIEIRNAATAQIAVTKTVTEFSNGSDPVSEGLLPATGYQTRARWISSQASDWTAWVAVTTDDLRVGREDLADGSIEDTFVVQSLAEQTVTAGSTATIVTLDLPTVTLGQLWRRAVKFEARRTTGGVPGTLRLQVRRKAYSGDAWSGWTTAKTFDINADFTTAWANYSNSGDFAATNFDTQYRFFADVDPGGGDLVLRNVEIVAKNIGVPS